MLNTNDLRWQKIKDTVNGKGADGEAFVKELQTLYASFRPEFAEWIGGLYDKNTGGFYFSNSARDTDGFLPDVESTYQAVDTICSVGFVEKPTDLPEDMQKQITRFVCSLQSEEDGYVYHPQWKKEDVIDARRGRHLMWANYLEKYFNFKMPYPDANERLSGKAGTKSSALPAHLLSEDAFIAYMDALDWEKDAYYAGNTLAAQSNQIRAAGFADIAADYLGRIQNPETGLWGIYGSYHGVNALLKIAAFYTSIKKPVPNAERAARETMRIISADIDKDAATVCWQYNVWYALEYLIFNLRKNGGEEGCRQADAIIRDILLNAPEAIRVTKEKILLFDNGDGSFRYMRNVPLNPNAPAPVSPRIRQEGDVNATVICLHRTVLAMMGTLDLPFLPIYDSSDYERFLKSIR